jgi:hypothetical protein
VRGFTEVLRAETQSLPIGSTVIVITPILSDVLRGALLRLRERGLRVVVCALTDAPPAPLPGLLLYHLPPPADAPYLRPPAPPNLRKVFGEEAAAPGPPPATVPAKVGM